MARKSRPQGVSESLGRYKSFRAKVCFAHWLLKGTLHWSLSVHSCGWQYLYGLLWISYLWAIFQDRARFIYPACYRKLQFIFLITLLKRPPILMINIHLLGWFEIPNNLWWAWLCIKQKVFLFPLLFGWRALHLFLRRFLWQYLITLREPWR